MGNSPNYNIDFSTKNSVCEEEKRNVSGEDESERRFQFCERSRARKGEESARRRRGQEQTGGIQRDQSQILHCMKRFGVRSPGMPKRGN